MIGIYLKKIINNNNTILIVLTSGLLAYTYYLFSYHSREMIINIISLFLLFFFYQITLDRVSRACCTTAEGGENFEWNTRPREYKCPRVEGGGGISGAVEDVVV